MFESLLRVLILVGVVIGVIAAGWNEPLRYRFLGLSEIAAEEKAIAPKVDPSEARQKWQPLGSSLDRGGPRRPGH